MDPALKRRVQLDARRAWKTIRWSRANRRGASRPRAPKVAASSALWFIMKSAVGCSVLICAPGGNMADRLEEFQKFRAELNEEILNCGHLGMKRFFALDHHAYEPGSLPTKTKELLGLVASAVKRCDDCNTYHLARCGEECWSRKVDIYALTETLIVGGLKTITIVS